MFVEGTESGVCAQGEKSASKHAKERQLVSDLLCLDMSIDLNMFVVSPQASLVVFLLAKINVANSNGTLARWEKGIVYLSQLYGWVYL